MLVSMNITYSSNTTCLYVQRNIHNASLVIQLNRNNRMSQGARDFIHKIIIYPINLSYAINVSLETPLNNKKRMNILSPAGIRQ